MTWQTKIILILLAALAPFIALKLMGRPIFIETKIKLEAEHQANNCLPLTTTSLIDTQLFIIEPSMGFAISNQGVLQQLGRIDLVFSDYPNGRVNINPGSSVKTCLRFRSNKRLDAIRQNFATLPETMLIQCKLGVLLGANELNYTRVYAIVFPCERYLKGFSRAP